MKAQINENVQVKVTKNGLITIQVKDEFTGEIDSILLDKEEFTRIKDTIEDILSCSID